MMRSLYSGVSGLRNEQTAMDVIGNNIANVNTVAFKSSTVTFQAAFAQLLQGASRPPGSTGGVNPIQIGSGMNIGSINQQFTQGSLESTGANTDLAIQGSAFFVLSNGQQQVYSRAGNFQLDADGRLIADNGFLVQGINADSTGNFSTGTAITGIQLPLGQKSPAQATSKVTLTGNLDQNGTAVIAAASPTAALATANPNASMGALTTTTSAVNGTYTLSQNVDGAVTLFGPNGINQTLTGVASGAQALNFNQLGVTVATTAAFTAAAAGAGTLNGAAMSVSSTATAPSTHSMGITTYDAAGAPHAVTLTFTKSATTGQWNWNAAVTGTTGAVTANSTGTATFSGTGTLSSFSPTNMTITPSGNSTPPFSVTINPGTINGFDGLAGFARQSNAVISGQDGYQAGDLKDISVDSNGVITGSFTNGVNRSLAQVALASFNNPSGLLTSGSNMFEQSANSGLAVVGFAGISNTSTITPGALENSNVDISQEFTNMIVTQRGFQASAKVITTSDQMLQDLVNLKQ